MNKVICGDCKEVLSKWEPELVDLIYLDPPFNSNRDYKQFRDVWKWDSAGELLLDKITSNIDNKLYSWASSMFEILGESVLMAYLLYMSERLLWCHYVLKGTGSIYLHCDQSASHYLKILMDEVFGRGNFRNEIIWGYRTGGASKQRFSKKHDVIFYYSKGDDFVFNCMKERVYYKKDFIGTSTDEFGRVFYDAYFRDVWDDEEVKVAFSTTKGCFEYPTQKPLKLLARIIKASSNKNDIVLDPFCGSDTTLEAAKRLGRNYIGIDISDEAINVCNKRLSSIPKTP